MTGDFKTEMMGLKVRHTNTHTVTEKAVCGRLMCSLVGME